METLPIKHNRKVYLMVNGWGETAFAVTNMKKAYDYLKANDWRNPVHYSFFSRSISGEKQTQWVIRPLGSRYEEHITVKICKLL